MDLHERFDDWLTAGAEGDPPRDLALHASGCEACWRSVAAVESLQAIDIGAAPLPPLPVAAQRSETVPPRLRYAIGAIAVILLGTSVAIGASGLLRPAQPAPDADLQSPREDELAGQPSTTETPPLATVAPTASATASPTPTPSSEEVVADATAAPIQAPAPRTPAPQPPGTPQPTAEPPTPTPSPVPTVAATLSPTPIESTEPSSSSPTPTISESPLESPTPALPALPVP